MELILYSLSFTLSNDPTSIDGVRETADWVLKQQTEQKKGGPWKKRLREQGYTV